MANTDLNLNGKTKTAISRSQLIADIRQLRSALYERGVTHLALFGSRARGDERLDSDVDVLVEVRDDLAKFSLFDLVGIQTELADQIGLPFSVVMRRSMSPEFAASIKNDIVEIY